MAPRVSPQIRRVWVLLFALAILVLLISFGTLFTKKETKVPRSLIKVKQSYATMSEQELLSRIQAAREKERPDPVEEAEQTIEELRARVDADLDDPERPALLQAMGNLYRHSLMDYENAAWCYQQIVLNYPDYGATPVVYINLADCYEKLGDEEGVQRTYLEMMRVLPQDSREYEYARQMLGL